MQILPPVQLASAAKGLTDKSASGAKNAPASSGTRNTQAFAELMQTPSFADLKKAPALTESKNPPSLPGAQNAPASSGARDAQALAGLTQAAPFADVKKASALAESKNLPSLPGAQNAPASSGARAMQALAGLKQAASFADVKKASALAESKNLPSLPGIRNAPASSGAKNAPSPPSAQNAPAFADALRQAEENVRAESGNSRHNSRTLADRIRSAIQDQRPGGSRQAQNSPLDGRYPLDAGARQTAAPADAGRDNARRTARQQPDPLESPPEQDTPDIRQEFTPLEKAPATPHSTNGVHYQLEELGFTQQELAKLRDNLLREGLSPKSLTVIEQLASHPHGATLGQLLTLMNDNLPQNISLSDSDKALLQNFAGKIDPGGALGKNVLQLLENSRPKEAWDALKSALADLDPLDTLVFEHGEAALLCKAFGVGPQASLAVLKQFGDAEGMLLTPDIFTALMLPAQQEIVSKAQQDDKLGQALAKHLQPLIEEARLRSEKERQAANGAYRRSKQSETLIRDKFMDKFHKDVIAPEKDEPNPQAKNADAFGRKDEAGRAAHAGRQAEASDGKEGRPGNTEELAAKTPQAQDDALAAQDRNKAAVAARTPDEASVPQKPASGQDAASRAETREGRATAQLPREDVRGNDRETSRDGNSEQRDARRDSPREGLLSRVEVRSGAPAADMHAASAFTAPTQAQERGPVQSARPVPFIREALQQADQGSLNRLANGGSRLELQLAPSELGAVTLILTSAKSGEISATIRSERSETAELMTRHLDMIRVSLEEQGLKVGKLEVQNQMLNNQDNWQGMEQHNSMREEQARREQLEHLRRLGRQSEHETLRARDMQLHEHTAEISEHGLHLVA